MGISCTWPYLVTSLTALVTAITALVRQFRHEAAPEPEAHTPVEAPPP